MSGTTAGTTSGTVLGVSYPQRAVLDRAFRKAGRRPQNVGSEDIALAQEILFVQLAEYIAAGFPLWTRQQILCPITIGSPNSPLPYGTVDVMHAYWRQFNPFRGAAVDSSGIPVSPLVGGVAAPDIAIAGPNPGVLMNLGAVTQVDTVGILPGFTTGFLLDGFHKPILDGFANPILASPDHYQANVEVLTSPDNITYTNVRTLPSTMFRAGVWSYFDLEPSISTQFIKVMLPGTEPWVLSQINICLANSSQTDLGLQNIDDYFNLPNKFEQSGRPNTVFVDRQRDQPVMKIWPTPNAQAFYSGTMVALSRRYIQDPGSLTNSLEIPARWIEGVTSRLGVRLMDELPPDPGAGPPSLLTYQAEQQRRTNLETAATKGEAIMWAEERPGGPMKIIPNLRAYTR